MLRSVVLEHPSQVSPLWSPWDNLAIASARPYCAPAWMMAWWKHVAPPHALLRVSALFDGDELVAIAPFFADRGFGGLCRYRLLGARTCAPLDILARRGTERAVVEALIATFATAQPRPDVIMLEGVPGSSPWIELLRHAWAGLRVRPQYSQPAPRIELSESAYDDWFKSRSAHFRSNLRRGQRELQKLGAVTKLSVAGDEVQRDIEAFGRLHRARWKRRGESGAVDARVERMLVDAAEHLTPSGRLQVWTTRVGDQDVSAQVFVAAGGTTAYWLGGFDNSTVKIHQPAVMTLLCAVEHAFRRRGLLVDLGPGAQNYKYDFASSEVAIDWLLLIPRGWRSLLARPQMLRPRARIFLAQRVGPRAKRVVRRLLAMRGALRSNKPRQSSHS